MPPVRFEEWQSLAATRSTRGSPVPGKAGRLPSAWDEPSKSRPVQPVLQGKQSPLSRLAGDARSSDGGQPGGRRSARRTGGGGQVPASWGHQVPRRIHNEPGRRPARRRQESLAHNGKVGGICYSRKRLQKNRLYGQFYPSMDSLTWDARGGEVPGRSGHHDITELPKSRPFPFFARNAVSMHHPGDRDGRGRLAPARKLGVAPRRYGVCG